MFVAKSLHSKFLSTELQDIKAGLSMAAVLHHYGLKPDKHDRLHCPFHPDKTPSLQIYPKTNTFCCFSGNCTAGQAVHGIERAGKGGANGQGVQLL